MNEFVKNLSPKEWEGFCAKILRYKFTARNVYEVPDNDKGDLGIEFFTVDGTIFQCYYPELNIDMATYKKKVQKKIRDDIQKLIKNEKAISAMLAGIKIEHWVLLITENRSKDLIKYCAQQKKKIVEAGLGFIDSEKFTVKIETANSYPDGMLFAQSIHNKQIDIALADVSEDDKKVWQQNNSAFASNINRKSHSLMGAKSDEFKDKVVKRYIQIEKFLDHLRDEHPDIHQIVENSARARLEKMSDDSVFSDSFDRDFVKSIVDGNEAAFAKHAEYLSDTNKSCLSFGYLSKWLAECYMDFKNG
ncbi:MAG: hypothetical protein RQ899_12940 [Pseudomonadales bacterium]|nr:hypothetical protein [Pseudomonadales bacterium]